ncbi:MAG: sugar phosphate nucleotidyltransferase [Armatimonadota bacterium]|nr:NTP transferase domain-containing protein [bacterium]
MTAFRGLILAAGKGSRFQSETGEPFPKVLRPVLGRPLVSYVVDTMRSVGIDDITLIVGFQAGIVELEMGSAFRYIHQPEQHGSGHAVMCAKSAFGGFDGHLLIMCGDSPLFASDTISRLMREHVETGASITLASAELDDPTGYGRIVRDDFGRIMGIVEEKCADPAQRAIREVNGGSYAFNSKWLFGNIENMAINEAGEYNLTDMVRVAIAQGRTVSAVCCDSSELLGVNTPDQLKTIEEMLKGRQLHGND